MKNITDRKPREHGTLSKTNANDGFNAVELYLVVTSFPSCESTNSSNETISYY